jgi:hypothetical protein
MEHECEPDAAVADAGPELGTKAAACPSPKDEEEMLVMIGGGASARREVRERLEGAPRGDVPRTAFGVDVPAAAAGLGTRLSLLPLATLERLEDFSALGELFAALFFDVLVELDPGEGSDDDEEMSLATLMLLPTLEMLPRCFLNELEFPADPPAAEPPAAATNPLPPHASGGLQLRASTLYLRPFAAARAEPEDMDEEATLQGTGTSMLNRLPIVSWDAEGQSLPVAPLLGFRVGELDWTGLSPRLTSSESTA